MILINLDEKKRKMLTLEVESRRIKLVERIEKDIKAYCKENIVTQRKVSRYMYEKFHFDVSVIFDENRRVKLRDYPLPSRRDLNSSILTIWDPSEQIKVQLQKGKLFHFLFSLFNILNI